MLIGLETSSASSLRIPKQDPLTENGAVSQFFKDYETLQSSRAEYADADDDIGLDGDINNKQTKTRRGSEVPDIVARPDLLSSPAGSPQPVQTDLPGALENVPRSPGDPIQAALNASGIVPAAGDGRITRVNTSVDANLPPVDQRHLGEIVGTDAPSSRAHAGSEERHSSFSEGLTGTNEAKAFEKQSLSKTNLDALLTTSTGPISSSTITTSNSDTMSTIVSILGSSQTGSAQQASATMAAAAQPPSPVVIASPEQFSAVVTSTIGGSESTKDRVVIQLDPPELGRVSVDFKFDSQGILHVTVTGESADAIRRLRDMHFELLDALESNGLSGGDVSYQQGDPETNQPPSEDGRDPPQAKPNFAASGLATVEKISHPLINIDSSTGINIKL